MGSENDFWELVGTCRAMRRVKPDAVPEDQLRRLIQAAQFAPSGSNAQDRHWIVVRDPVQKLKLAEMNRQHALPYVAAQREMIDKVASEGAAAPEITDVGPMTGWVGHQEIDKRRRMIDAVEWQALNMENVPVLIVGCLEFEQEPPDAFAAGASAGGEVWPAVQNLLLAARSLELAAVPTTLGLRVRSDVQEALGLPSTVVPLCLIPVGFPLGRFGPVSRKPIDDVLHWDRWS